MKEDEPILMTEEFWSDSPLSIVRHYGHIKMRGNDYVIVNKEGKDIFECSKEADEQGRDFAIPPGEPCDLCRADVVPIYRKLGREKFMEFLKKNPDVWTLKEVKDRLKEWQKNQGN